MGVMLLVDSDGYMKEIDVSAFGADIHGRPTDTTHGRPTVGSFELAEWEPFEDGLGGMLKNALGRLGGKK